MLQEDNFHYSSDWMQAKASSIMYKHTYRADAKGWKQLMHIKILYKRIMRASSLSISLHVLPLDSLWRPHCVWFLFALAVTMWCRLHALLVHDGGQSKELVPLSAAAAPSTPTSASLSASSGYKRARTSSSAWCGRSRTWQGAEQSSPSPAQKMHLHLHIWLTFLCNLAHDNS